MKISWKRKVKKDGEYFLDIGVKYPKQLHELYNDSLFFNKKNRY